MRFVCYEKSPANGLRTNAARDLPRRMALACEWLMPTSFAAALAVPGWLRTLSMVSALNLLCAALVIAMRADLAALLNAPRLAASSARVLLDATRLHLVLTQSLLPHVHATTNPAGTGLPSTSSRSTRRT